ncbi:uncharacterized protein LOC143174613 [Nomia melanderi]|uniref:uncharacterized protein LOC143174613 n=1 Tax=Nomia melanderi TaxID=2448451 RepID=UPI003FCD9BD7
MTHENIKLKKYDWRIKSDKVAVSKLDAYIRKYETNFEKISKFNDLSKKQLKLLKLARELTKSIEKEKAYKQQAFEILKISNNSIKETIFKLQDSMKMYKENVNSEIVKLNNLNTDRLLKINYIYT